MFKTVEAEVENLLTKYPKLRDSDSLLYGSYLASQGVSMTMSLGDFFKKIDEMGVATYETVSRIRRKLQENRPDLQATNATRRLRKEIQLSFFEYGRQR